jgi:uncharacterized membrane protein
VKPTRLAGILLAVALAIGAAIAAGPMFAPACTLANGTDVVTVSMHDLSRGSARFFCYRDRSGHLIRFVIAREEDGTVRSVFDACRQCYRFHKGYTIADGFLICRLCGNRYKLDEMRVGLASCQPVQLENTQYGGKVEVRVAALERGHSLF